MTAKRVFDLIGAVILLVVLSPLFLAVALLITLRRESRGAEGVLRHKGRDVRAPDLKGLLRRDGRGSSTLLRRRTMAGRDGHTFPILTFRTPGPYAALPLLLHVVRGQMSLVGPCPLVPDHPECVGEARRRLSVRPGLTGLWQISGRSELPWEERELLDLHYVDHHWLGMDLAILARTLPAVHRRRTAAGKTRPARLA
ncbi:sugar transferase [Streptomyces sp. ISL-36]|uniref:sugar transferase n=1 Tax=Streptomyces sp. ISL-36 TaxID=2819182 RepID=UPI001BEA8087|nr:sugar transferase [Streptomyces sp. ISL-36]MBT2440741.1 sugar transferase [Streptomyces sp. ISL-36]